MKISLPIRYACSISLIITATSIVLSGTLISSHIDMLKRNLIDKGYSMVESFANHSEFGMVFYNPAQLNGIASSFLKKPEVVFAMITGENGKILVRQGIDDWITTVEMRRVTRTPGAVNPADARWYQEMLNKSTGEKIFHFSLPIYSATFHNENPELTLLSEDIHRQTIKEEIATAHLGVSLNAMHATIREAQKKSVFLTIVIIIVGILTSTLLSMYVTRPIKNLLAATHRIADGNLDFCVVAETNDEIGELATSFNQMTRILRKTTVSRDYLDNVLRSMNDILIVVDKNGIIERVNASASQRLNYQGDELLGREFDSIWIAEDHESFREIVKKCPQTNIERTYLTKDRHDIPMLFSCSLMHGSSRDRQAVSFVTVAQDISGLKSIENDLRRAKENAEQANAAKSEFLANMSHELRTPLHSILSFSELGIDKVDSADSAKLLDYYEEINKNGGILLQLLNSLLDLAKLESGKMIFNFMPVDLYDLILSVTNEFGLICSERKLYIGFDKETTKITSIIDPDKIKQVIRNILANAVRFSPDGREIIVKLSNENSRVRVSIVDHGVGIPVDELDGIFEKFIQSSKTRTGAGGTGLGLSICREIITRHHGRIWAENCAHGGALFTFEIPAEIGIVSDFESES